MAFKLHIVTQSKAELDPIDRALNAGARDFAISLRGVTITRREEPAFDCNRQEERAAWQEFFAVDIAAGGREGNGRVDARLGWRHPHHAHERRDRHLDTKLVASGLGRGRSTRPVLPSLGHTQTQIERAGVVRQRRSIPNSPGRMSMISICSVIPG